MNEQYVYNPQTPNNNQTIPVNYGQVAGDDSVTQIIPGNYGQVTGDDSVTEIIPENYGQVVGDDSVTQFLPDSTPVFKEESHQLSQPYFSTVPTATEPVKSKNPNLIIGLAIGITSVVALIVGLLIIL